MGQGSRARLCLILLWILLPAPAAGALEAAPRPYAGRPLQEALDDLQARGLLLVYSSDLVLPDMMVGVEPVADTPRGILDELIIPHGLQAQEGPGGRLLIVRTPREAQGVVEGTVVGASDRQPIPLAWVRVVGTGLRALTSRDGRFRVTGVPAGAFALEVQLPGLAAQSFDAVSIAPGRATRVTLELVLRSTLLERIIVTPSQYTLERDRPEIRRTLSGDAIERLPRLGDDVHRAVGRLPGTAAGDRSAPFNLRGGEQDEVQVLLDGLEIDQPFHLKDFLSVSGVVDSKAIGSVDFLSGGLPAEYGDRMSGALELTSLRPTGANRSSIGASIINTSLLTDGSTAGGAAHWLVSGRAWYPDALVDVVSPGGEDINPDYFDLYGTFETRLSGGTLMSGHLLAARDGVDFTAEETASGAKAGSNSEYVWLSLKTPWTGRLYSQTVISLAQIDRYRRGVSDDPIEGNAAVRDERSSNIYGLKQDWTFRRSDRFLLKWGVGGRRWLADYRYASHTDLIDPLLGTGGVPVVTDRDLKMGEAADSWGVYVAGKFRPVAPLTLEAGLRRDAQSHTHEYQVSPRFNVVYSWGDRNALRAGWGRFYQSQRVTELQVEDGVNMFFPAQLAEHWVLSVEHAFSKGVYLRGDAYLKKLTRVRPRYENLFNPIELFPEAESDRVRIAPDRAETRGVELFLQVDPGRRVSWWAGYALSWAEDRVDGDWIPRAWDQRHALNVSVNLRAGPLWEINLAGVYHTGWPTTEVTATAVTNPDMTQTVFPVIGPRNRRRYPDFHRLDLKVSRRVPVGRGTLKLYLEVINAYNHRNVCCIDEFVYLPHPDDSVTVETREGFWLQQVPSAGFLWEIGF